MSFDESAVFPVQIAYGSSGGPGYKTLIQETMGGQEQRIQRWEYSRRQWNAGVGVKDLSDLRQVIDFYISRRGAKRGFRFLDPFDFTSSTTVPHKENTANALDQLVGVGDDSTVDFQLIKTYSNGGQSVVRNIEKPISGSVLVKVNGSDQTEDSDFSVDYTTGVITFDTAPTAALEITAGFNFHVPCRFGDDIDELMDVVYDSFEAGSIRIPIIEILSPTQVMDNINYGGSTDKEFGVSFTLSALIASFWALVATTTGLNVNLPDPTNFPPGHNYFALVNEGSNSFNLKDHNGTTLVSLSSGDAVTVHLAVDDGGNKIWYAW